MPGQCLENAVGLEISQLEGHFPDDFRLSLTGCDEANDGGTELPEGLDMMLLLLLLR